MTIRDAIQIVVARRASFRQARTSALGPDSLFRVFSNLLSLDELQMRYASGFSESIVLCDRDCSRTWRKP